MHILRGIRMMMVRLITRATRHYELRATCFPRGGVPTPCQYSSPLDGFSAYEKVTYEMGCNNVTCDNKTFIMPAVEASKNADATILLVGLDKTVEGEGLDRNDLLLPGYQTELILQVIVASKGPIILVIMSGSAVDISFAKTDDRVKAILWAGYSGEEGGRAIADVVYGKYNPGKCYSIIIRRSISRCFML